MLAAAILRETGHPDFAAAPPAAAAALAGSAAAAAAGPDLEQRATPGGGLRFLRALHELRTGGHKYPHSVGQATIYWKYNRAQRGELRAGDPAPDVQLVRLGGAPCSLHALVRAAHPRPLVVLSGSYS
jgi:hypothetical protein